MQPTRRFWATATLALALALASPVVASPLPLAGAALLGAWLVATAVAFTVGLVRLDRQLAVEQSVTPRQTAPDDPVRATLAVSLDAPSPLAFTVAARPPVGAGGREADRRLSLAPGDSTATAVFEVALPVAGLARFDPPSVTVEDRLGLFTERIERGSPVSFRVQPRRPRQIHVGEGGERLASTYGEHGTERRGAGLEPAAVRPYVAGDSARRIDWRATARLGELHTREFEAETELSSLLIVDHRASLGDGPDGERKLDYLRAVALAVVGDATELNDPLGLLTVGEEGLTTRTEPAASGRTYREIRRTLEGLEPRTGSDLPEGRTGPSAARQLRSRLGDGAFAETLGPYFEAREPYVERVAENPLFAAVERATTNARGRTRVFLLTDDSDRAGVREAARVARRRGQGRVVVLLAPSVLYERGGLADLEAAYDRYLDAEEFRRELAGIDGVEAYEVAPGDRLEALLGARRDQRRAAGGR